MIDVQADRLQPMDRLHGTDGGFTVVEIKRSQFVRKIDLVGITDDGSIGILTAEPTETFAVER